MAPAAGGAGLGLQLPVVEVVALLLRLPVEVAVRLLRLPLVAVAALLLRLLLLEVVAEPAQSPHRLLPPEVAEAAGAVVVVVVLQGLAGSEILHSPWPFSP